MAVERTALVKAVGVAALALLAGGALLSHLSRLDLEHRRRAAAELARGPADALQQELARSLDAVSVLGALVEQGADPASLGGVAERLLALHGTTANLQLAQDGVIRYLWPLRGNEPAMGFDIGNHPVHGPWYRRARDTRQPLLYGPFELVQGGQGLALRSPVFVHEPSGERFWGVSSAIVRVPALVEAGRLGRLTEAGYAYRLTRSGVDGEALVLASSLAQGGPLEAPVEVEVQLLAQTWRLGVAPLGGWRTSGPTALTLALLVVAVLAGLLAYRTLAQPELLRREVAARTAELAVAHREQQAALDAQRQSQKLEALGLLAGGVAHDFNNLLAAIMGHADVLAHEATPGSEVEESARTIAQAAQRAAELTRQLLAFARLGQHRQEPVSMHALIAEATALLGRALDKRIRIETRLEAARSHVLGDPGQLQQVLVNLAVNARDAMSSGGTLTLVTSERPGAGGGSARLVLEVRDTGAGIPPEHLARIFEPFFTTKGEGRGTGLGLATVYGIVKAHGGEVRVVSEVGRGTCFIIDLPLVEGAGAVSAPAEAAPRKGSGVVLVVDDEALVGHAAVRILKRLGYQPVHVSGGEEALAWLDAQPARPVAVLLDLSMPGMDGATCFRRIRQRWPDARVLLNSGFAANAGAQQLLDEGAAGFLQKPWRAAELADALAAAISTREVAAAAPGGGD